jgi:hypothetical protein
MAWCSILNVLFITKLNYYRIQLLNDKFFYLRCLSYVQVTVLIFMSMKESSMIHNSIVNVIQLHGLEFPYR